MKTCAKCRWPPVIGSRCVFHWLKRIVDAKDLSSSNLWKRKQSYLTSIVTGRYLARVAGQEPPSIQSILDELTAFRLGAPGKAAVTEILEAVDAAAERAKERSNNAN